jgi:hypothetical protein
MCSAHHFYCYLPVCADADHHIEVSHSGQGTRKKTMWAVPDTKLLLVDCVGSTSCDVAHSDAAAADLMIVVMGDSNRAEHMHGDYLLWALRLENTVRTIFVLPKFDQVFQQGTRRYTIAFFAALLTEHRDAS